MSNSKPGQIIEAHAAYSSNEDGRTTGILGYYTSELAARGKARGKGGMGSQGKTEKVMVIEASDGKFYAVKDGPVDIDGDADEVLEKLRESARGKLDEDERAALGIPSAIPPR